MVADFNEKLGRWGKDRPHGIALKREDLSTPTEKTPEPPPHPYTGRRYPGVWADLFTCALAWGERGDFFNHSLKFAPTGIRTQDLWSAARVS